MRPIMKVHRLHKRPSASNGCNNGNNIRIPTSRVYLIHNKIQPKHDSKPQRNHSNPALFRMHSKILNFILSPLPIPRVLQRPYSNSRNNIKKPALWQHNNYSFISNRLHLNNIKRLLYK